MMKRLAAPIIALSLFIPTQRVDALFGVGLKYVGDSFSVGEWIEDPSTAYLSLIHI